MRFYVIRSSTNELIEVIDKPDLAATCKYMHKVYGEDSQTDLFTERSYEQWKDTMDGKTQLGGIIGE